LSPNAKEEVGRMVDKARAILGEAAFAAAWAQGQAIDMEQAIEYALKGAASGQEKPHA